MAKQVPLQMMMVNLTNGQRGMFIGLPLVDHKDAHQATEVENIMFSDIQKLPEEMTLAQLMDMVKTQYCLCNQRAN
ncbi:MAG: hypothetical protein KKE76_02440 [Gammaproteobacteria bacterium]|nr:hypothetical protein [Gammaproteobacteria bacterium]